MTNSRTTRGTTVSGVEYTRFGSPVGDAATSDAGGHGANQVIR
ncbi:hypothetical protein ACLI4R_00700 [Natrialbaceae archaeon A-chndr2]